MSDKYLGIKQYLLGDWRGALRFYLPLTAIAVLAFLVVYFTGWSVYLGTVDGYGWSNSKLLDSWFAALGWRVYRDYYIIIFPIYYFCISVPFQEYVFRVLPLRSRVLSHSWIYLGLISLVFALLHAYYMDPVSIILVFGMGLANAMSYRQHKSFLAICLFHLLTAAMAFTLNLA